MNATDLPTAYSSASSPHHSITPTLHHSFVFLALSLICSDLAAQERVIPEKSKGGRKFGEPWAEVPESFRSLGVPEWPAPADLSKWKEKDRGEIRTTLLQCLGEMPPRPDPKAVKVTATEEYEAYTVERFEFFNGVDMTVPGILVLPRTRSGPLPVVLGLHGHSGSKNDYLPNPENPLSLGWMLVQRGFAVAAIDGYFNGERVGKGPRGRMEKDAGGQELSLFKLHLWQGRTSWGLMVRDEQCLLDYLETRPELDRQRIGATGMSMGCTRAWWLAALDERVKAIVGVACFTRYTELLAHHSSHGIYYFVPGLLKHFDTEAIYALVAPRPMLQLSGDQDYNAPPDGIEVLEKKIGAVYQLYGKPQNFRSVLYKNTGHEYLPEMRHEMVAWFDKHLATAGPEIVSVKKIWDQGAHNAFTDLIRFHDKWYCTFREAEGHVGGDGKLRVLESTDGDRWESAALLAEEGIDLRDPKLSITPDGRLMIVAGGSIYRGTKTLQGRQPRATFSTDGHNWTLPERVLSEGEWLWRVTWHEGTAYGVSYDSTDQSQWRLKLFSSGDGVHYDLVTRLEVPGKPNETTLRFAADGTMLALVRREADDTVAWIGTSREPYTEWNWKPTQHRVGGPNFIVLPGGLMWAAGRSYPGGAKTVLARMTHDTYEPVLTFPSGGDTSYAGLVWHDGLLWMSYYSSHEGKTAIYLAKVRLPE